MKKTLKMLVAIAVLACTLAMAAAAVTLYAPDGRTIDVYYSEVNSYVNVGWYRYPVTTLYSMDGRSVVVATYDVNAYKSVGWYEKVTLYAADGRTISVLPWEVSAYVSYGWSTEQFVTMYALDGRTISVPQSQVYSYSTVGWYQNYNDVVQTLYASDGRTITVYKAQVASYVAVGWSTTPVYATSNVYYPGTMIPAYTYVTGIPVNDVEYYDGITFYEYDYTSYGDWSEWIDYTEALIDLGWYEENVPDLETELTTVYSYSAGGVYFLVMVDYDEDLVYVIF